MCIRRETREKARRSLAFSRVSKPHTHITHMLRQCTSIVYLDNNPFLRYNVPGDGNCFFHLLSLLINVNTTYSSFYRNIICTHIIHNWSIWEDKIFHSHTNNMTVELYPQHTINRNGWATATEIEAAANLFVIWFKYKYLATTVFTLYFKFIQCKLSYLH